MPTSKFPDYLMIKMIGESKWICKEVKNEINEQEEDRMLRQRRS